ncbi:MAG: hypothetical protein P1V97_38320, partial [Planctomycetota bacterium]|nr:hypothetical protein [Planctomycetota bacterium]
LCAFGHSFLKTRGRQRSAFFSALLILGYVVSLVIGLQNEIRFLCSFEFMVLWTTPVGVAFMVLVARHGRAGGGTDLLKAYLSAGLILLAAVVSHGVFGFFRWGEHLWDRGLWFTENDLFHIGMIIWLFAIRKMLFPQIQDVRPESDDKDAEPMASARI